MCWKNRFLVTVFSLLILLCGNVSWALDACDPAVLRDYQPVSARYTKGLLFKVEKCGLPPSYLFATIHTDDPAVIASAADAFAVLKDVKAAGFEYIMTPQASAKAQQTMYFPNHERMGLRARLGDKDFSQLVMLLTEEAPLPPPVVDRMRPWAAAMLLQSPDDVTEEGIVLDEKLQQEAQRHRITLFGLESPEEQFSIFNHMPPDAQLEMLREAMSDKRTMDQMNRELNDNYLSKDLFGIATLGRQSFDELSDPELRSYLESKLVTERNQRMVTRMLPRLQEGAVFIAVGALHYPGEDGIFSLLEKRGYLISPVE